MRGTVYKAKAIQGWIIVITALLVISVWPLRLFRREVAMAVQTPPAAEIPRIDDETSWSVSYTADFEKLGDIEVFVTGVEGGRYLSLSIYDANNVRRCRRFVDLGLQVRPKAVRVTCGISQEKDMSYRIELSGRYSAYRISGMTLYYDLPAGRTQSLLLMAAFLAGGLLLSALTGAYFRKRKERNRLLVLSLVVERPLQVLIIAFFALLFVMNVPLHMFNRHTEDIVFYAAGIVLSALIALYVLHRLVAAFRLPRAGECRDVCSMILIALAIESGVEYMNGLYNIFHDVAYEKLKLCLLGIVLLSFSGKVLFHKLMMAGYAVSLVLTFALNTPGAWTIDDDVAYELMNERDLLHTGVWCLGALAALACVLAITDRIREGASFRDLLFVVKNRLSPYAYILILTFAVLTLFRNGQDWIVATALFFGLILLFSAKRCHARTWFSLFYGGVALHFGATVMYCLLHRAWQHDMLTRYSMTFHTATVTGEYLALVIGVFAAALFVKSANTPGLKLRGYIETVWKEMLLLGTALCYALFTMGRSVILSAVLTILLLAFAASWKMVPKNVMLALLSVLLLFMPCFTMQRIVPSLRGDFRILPGPEENSADGLILGRCEIGSPSYIRLARFFQVSTGRLTGNTVTIFKDDADYLNLDESGRHLYGLNGVPLVHTEEEAPAQEEVSSVEVQEEQTGEEELLRLSGGRNAIWRSYWQELSMTGHEGLGNDNTLGDHAHNSYLQMLFTLGIPAGILFFVWVGITIGTGFIRCRKQRDFSQSLLVLGASLSFGIMSMFDWTFQFNNPSTIMMMLSLAPLLWKQQDDVPVKEEG